MLEELKENCPPAVREYFTQVQKASDKRDKDAREHEATRPRDLWMLDGEARSAFLEKKRLIDQEYVLAMDKVADCLKASDDPQVKFIMDNCWTSDNDEAIVALSKLPLTYAEAVELSFEENWCRDGHDFVQRARNDGVLSGVDPYSPATWVLVEHLYDEFEVTSEQRNEILRYVKDIINEAKQSS